MAALLAAMLVSGCVSTGLEGVTAKVARYNPIGPGETTPAREIPMIVASTHPDRGAPDRAPGRARISTLVATIPPGHAPGDIERPSLRGESPKRHFTLRDRAPVAPGQLSAAVSQRLAGRPAAGRDVLVYVHGYNTGRDEATYRLAQIVADTGFAGLPVLFTWPATSGLLGYGEDRERATTSRDAMEKLLTDLAANPDVGRIHVLAHSMGTWIAMEGLRQTAIAGQPGLGGKLGDIMLAHPDLDIEVFKAQVARLGRADNLTIFVTSNDRALAVSRRLAGRDRLGALDLTKDAHLRAMAELGVRVVDLSNIAQGWVHHGTYAEAPQVTRMIGARLAEPRVVEAAVEEAPLAAPAAPAPPPAAALPDPAPAALAPSADAPAPIAKTE